ncbi:MAG: hypothetical protein KDK71_03330 [Chlamydiia bacterium]|nr:hypothetical protein [Chlamydiia bacterium]
MNQTSTIIFRRLVERGNKTASIRYLTPSEQEQYQSIAPSEGDPFAHPLSTRERLKEIHYSWMITFLEPFTKKDKIFILASLEKKQASKLQKHFQIKEKDFPPIKKVGKDYLVRALYDWLISDQKEFLPIEFLPKHPLSPLLTLTKNELQALVDYLGLHDLALELKHVIKADQIKKIQNVLSKEEQEYLKKQIKRKEPISFARLNLDGWNGDGEKLKAILHHRGFNRLAKALFGCHPSFLWHLCHKIDTGRAKILRKFFTDIKNDEAQSVLINQTLEIIPLVKNGSVHE